MNLFQSHSRVDALPCAVALAHMILLWLFCPRILFLVFLCPNALLLLCGFFCLPLSFLLVGDSNMSVNNFCLIIYKRLERYRFGFDLVS